MLKIEDFCESIYIHGYPEQIAMEFEDLARAVREGFCKRFGEEIGNGFYMEILSRAEMSKEASAKQAEAESELIKKDNPELFIQFMGSQTMKSFMGQVLRGGRGNE